MQCDVTGYNWQELAMIERAFEGCEIPVHDPKLGPLKFNINQDQWMLNGLFAVVDVLCEIHGMNTEEKEEAKLLFVKS
jgi:hypothetical protein